MGTAPLTLALGAGALAALNPCGFALREAALVNLATAKSVSCVHKRHPR